MNTNRALIEDIKYMLTRAPIPRGQLSLYKALYDAGDKGFSRRGLADLIREGEKEGVDGVLGALGNRILQTGRFKQDGAWIENLFYITRDEDGLCYVMRPELRKAIEELSVLRVVLKLSMQDILEYFDDEDNQLILK
ncbi:MAG: hypothetical protein WCF84_10400 [Anaerolineae bacterium]